MKKFISIFVMAIITGNASALEKELDNFKHTLNFYIDFTISGSSDISRISFNGKIKAISYKSYSEGGKFTTAAVKWENDLFINDDYNVNENLTGTVSPGYNNCKRK